MEEKKEIIRISVRNLVEFILRQGDLDNRRTGAADKEAMLKGGKIHRKIQKQMKGNYQPEVSLSFEKEYEKFNIRVEGRADGIIEEDNEFIIDEIKGVFRDISYLEEPVPVHLAQAMCYACILGMEKGLSKVFVQMTYCQMETEEIKRFKKEFEIGWLKKWFMDLLAEYYKWAYFQYERRQIRRESMENLEFPFPYREGQKELVAGAFHTIKQGKQLFIQAPTGIGKTMAVLYPAIRAVGEGYGDKIFYLTAKTITRTVAEEAFSILKERGLSYKTVTITAKEKLCLCGEPECNPEKCAYAKGHFDRVNDAVYELLTTQDAYSRDVILEHAKKHHVCPFEMCLDISSWTDAIICDYNYVFDPNVYLKRFFAENVKGDYLFLIDEAHNLVDRGRKMYSAVLVKEDFLRVKKLVEPYGRKLYRALDKCNKLLLEYKRECEEYQVLENTGSFALQLMNVYGEMEIFLEQEHEEKVQKEVLDFSFQIRHFLNMHELLDENYVIYTHHDEEGKFCLTLFCVNPKVNLQNCLDKGRSTVFFSATLLPLGYYRSLFSTRADDYAICAKSPFDRENLGIFVASDVSSKYTRRGEEEYRRLADYIYQTVAHRKGNYMVFFPSYRMMEDVQEHFSLLAEGKDIETIVQETGMQESDREEFLAYFDEDRDGALVGFCVMGGIFSEGIDLTGEKLVGALIVGTGLPQIGYEREILKNYYDEKGMSGFDYAYRYPGMNKVQQAAGRVIRTKEDKGVVLLLDERFLQNSYRGMFPAEWEHYQICKKDTISKWLDRFWSKTYNEE